MKFKRFATAAAMAAGLSIGGISAVQPAPAAAAGFITIYPNYANNNCGFLGSVRAIQVAAFPGGTTPYHLGNWAPLQARNGASTHIVANIWCNYPWSKSGTSFKVKENWVTAVANKSYYF
ncbi:hypothetical protein [Gordonia oryzae]|uniref:hypothetical protein n=1 Tax=Gordonia oryzae TaxID=2487349 RepID=UPI003F82D63A